MDNQEKRKLSSIESEENIETYIPDDIIKIHDKTNERIGETVWPNDRAGEIVRLSDELARLRQNQLTTLQNFEAEQVPTTLPEHNKVRKKYNKVQIQQLEAMQTIIEAQKKAKINETKAGNLNAVKEISKFNQQRLIDYSKSGAKSIGNMAKYLAIGAGASALWITKAGIEIGKEAVKAVSEIWYSLWAAHRDYRENYPKL